MIIKGGAAGNVGFWTQHLMRDDTNDEVRLIEISGLIADNLRDALREMQAIARQSRSRGNFMYQANINPRAGEELTAAQWHEAVERLEKNLRLEGHQRVVVEHVKDGRCHRHVIWNRVDVETLKVVDIKGNYSAHAQTARALEQAFGLQPTPSPKPKLRSGDSLWAVRAELEAGVTRTQVAADLSRIWVATATGQEFQAAIETAGYILARGDRRDFCVVDRSGRVHSLARRLESVDLSVVRMRLSDIALLTLPTVAGARKQQRKFASSMSMRASRSHARSASKAPGKMTRRPITSSLGIVRRRPAGWSWVGQRRPFESVPPRPAMGSRLVDHASRANDAFMGAVTLPYRASVTCIVDAVFQSAIAEFDASAFGRAEAAAFAELTLWQARIAAVVVNCSLSAAQRASAVASLRVQSEIAVRTAHRRIIEDEMQRANAAKRWKPRKGSPNPLVPNLS